MELSDMMSASEGGMGHGKTDVVMEVASLVQSISAIIIRSQGAWSPSEQGTDPKIIRIHH